MENAIFLCYIILHYMEAETTIECISSIIENATISDYRIIVVDNASNNGSFEKISAYFREEPRIIWICNEENYGFSKGNNTGYRYAREHFSPQYIVIGNNDLLFVQKEFVKNLKELGEKYPFYVAGPDIITNAGKHQNPHRTFLYSAKLIKRKNFNRKIVLAILKMKKRIPLLKGVDFVEKKYFEHKKESFSEHADEVIVQNVVLHGSCVIFSKSYIEKHEDAFPEHTFLYMEEDILALRCKKRGYPVYYFPSLKVIHKEDVSTNSIMKNKLEKQIFVLEQMSKSVDTYIKLLEQDEI